MIKYTKLHYRLEMLSLLVLTILLVNFFIHWSHLPEQVPVHFDRLGNPNRWGNRVELLLVPGIAIGIYSLLLLTRFIPLRFWSVPCKITDKNKDYVYSTSFTLLQWTKLEILFFMMIFSFYQVQGKAPPDIWGTVLTAVLAVTLIAHLTLILRYKSE